MVRFWTVSLGMLVGMMIFNPASARADLSQLVEKGEEYLESDDVLDRLICVLVVVESRDNDDAIGDKHLTQKAYGALQIRQPAVDDFNRWHGTSYKAKDCLGNRILSVAICRSYLRHYGDEERLGKKATYEDLARMWNGGPNGHKRSSTDSYWRKVRRELEQE